MPIYDQATNEQRDKLNEVVRKYHGHLFDAGVTFDLLRAFAKPDKNGDPRGNPLSLHGWACAAIVRVIPYKQRVKGAGDAEIVIDGDYWELLTEEQQEALLDHECEHLVLRTSKKKSDHGAVLRDDLERPLLRLRQHDFKLEGFDSIVRRHGANALEFEAYEKFQEKHGQLWFTWVETDQEAAA